MYEDLIGEIVRIKTYEQLIEEFDTNEYGDVIVPGLPMYKGTMSEELCGKFVKIINDTPSGYFGTDNGWNICIEMIDQSSLCDEMEESAELDTFLGGYSNGI